MRSLQDLEAACGPRGTPNWFRGWYSTKYTPPPKGFRLEVGMLITTNYSGPYRITRITRDCTCQCIVDTEKPEWKCPPHYHLTMVSPYPRGHIDYVNGEFYINGIEMENLMSIGETYCGLKTEIGKDWVEVLSNDHAIQSTLF